MSSLSKNLIGRFLLRDNCDKYRGVIQSFKVFQITEREAWSSLQCTSMNLGKSFVADFKKYNVCEIGIFP